MAEFAANNNESASTKPSFFFAYKNLYLHTSFNRVELSDASSRERIFNKKALDISGNMQTIWEFLQKALAAVKKSQSK